MINLNLPELNIDFGNFDPQEITTDETVNAVLIVDVSPSISNYVRDMNNAFRSFLEEMQQSRLAEKLMVSIIEFNENVTIRSGFQPITCIKADKISFWPCGSGTALYDALLTGINNASAYRTNLENSGVNCRTLIFVITDGEDNSSANSADIVKMTLENIVKQEKNMLTFETILFGVGSSASFTEAQKETGIKHLAVVGNTGKEIKKMIGFISESISKSSDVYSPIVF